MSAGLVFVFFGDAGYWTQLVLVESAVWLLKHFKEVRRMAKGPLAEMRVYARRGLKSGTTLSRWVAIPASRHSLLTSP